MAEILMFHHAQGLTAGVLALADELRAAGHTVHTPDQYDGNTFDDLDSGIDYARTTGFGALLESGVSKAEGLPDGLVYAGFSLGAMPAQMLAQTRPGAKGLLLFHGALPMSEFGGTWPDGVPVQIHAMQADPFFEEDEAAAREIVAAADDAELFVYPGDKHLFSDSSLTSYDAEATKLMMQRVKEFLDR